MFLTERYHFTGSLTVKRTYALGEQIVRIKKLGLLSTDQSQVLKTTFDTHSPWHLDTFLQDPASIMTWDSPRNQIIFQI